MDPALKRLEQLAMVDSITQQVAAPEVLKGWKAKALQLIKATNKGVTVDSSPDKATLALTLKGETSVNMSPALSTLLSQQGIRMTVIPNGSGPRKTLIMLIRDTDARDDGHIDPPILDD